MQTLKIVIKISTCWCDKIDIPDDVWKPPSLEAATCRLDDRHGAFAEFAKNGYPWWRTWRTPGRCFLPTGLPWTPPRRLNLKVKRASRDQYAKETHIGIKRGGRFAIGAWLFKRLNFLCTLRRLKENIFSPRTEGAPMKSPQSARDR